ncbi:MAG: hypothetical protein JYX80_05975 [Candidatus Scalindua sediminis]|nr:hypothetical protein [Candidatus Scalindua sediminis]
MNKRKYKRIEQPYMARLRIKQYVGNETDKYDNGVGQPIGGGSIVVHSK